MAMLILQRDGNGCMQRSYRARPPRTLPSVALLRGLTPMDRLVGIDYSAPIYSNDAGAPEVVVPNKKFACVGQSPPHDHPHVYLEMGAARQIACPYCGTRYRYFAGPERSQPKGPL